MDNSSIFKTEADFVAWIRRRSPRRVPGLTLGIGDDAALVRVPDGHELILTTDMSIEGVHFAAGLHPPQSVGHRALARSLSDIAAMGGEPRYVLLSMAFTEGTTRTWLKGFFDGLFSLGRRFKVAVIGGDTAVTRGAITIDTIVAGIIPRGTAGLRSGARAGDAIFVSGRLGMAALGLRHLSSHGRIRTALQRAAVHAHLYPEPQCALGRFLSEHRMATAMMDLSDGLSIDLKRLCTASGLGAELLAERIPAPGLPDFDDALALALHGGEDYQLLFTVPAAKTAGVPRRFGRTPLQCVGQIRASRGLTMIAKNGRSVEVPAQGYDHFARLVRR